MTANGTFPKRHTMSDAIFHRFPRNLVALAAVFLIAGYASVCFAEQMSLELDPDRTTIEFNLEDILHKVHGTFKMKSGSFQYNTETGSVSGSVVVDANSGDSGSKSRDGKMGRDILESNRYPEISFTPTTVGGSVSREGDSMLEVQGAFRLHGEDHTIVLKVPVRITGNEFTATTEFVIPYVQWGLKNPSMLFLRVSDKVNIKISAAGRLIPAS